MSGVVKLGLAAVLAVAAGVLNLLYLRNSREKPTQYVLVVKDVKSDTPLEASMLGSLAMPGDAVTLAQTLIPFNERQVLLGVRTTRDYARGDVIFQRDLPTATPYWDVLGPFRLLSVGDELLTPTGESSRGSGGNTNTITVAVRQSDLTTPDSTAGESSRRLLQIIDAIRNRGSNRDSRLRLVAIQVYRGETHEPDDATFDGTASNFFDESDTPTGGRLTIAPAPGDTDRLGLREGEIALIVPLENVQSIPSVLMIGRNIGFVVPAYRP